MRSKSAFPRLWIVVFILLSAWAFLLIRANGAWVGHQDNNGAWISAAIRNYQRYGFLTLGGMVSLSIEAVPLSEQNYYTTHPPAAVWWHGLPVLASDAFGAAGRLDPVMLRVMAAGATVIGTAALYRFARRAYDHKTAVWSIALYSLTPMTLYFGRMPDHEAPAIALAVLFAAMLLDWLRKPARWRWIALAALIVGGVWTSWGGIIVMGCVGFAGLIVAKKGQRVPIIALGGVALAALAALLLYYNLRDPEALQALFSSYFVRSGNLTADGLATFTLVDYARVMAVRLLTLMLPTTILLAIVGMWFTVRRGVTQGAVVTVGLLIGGFVFPLVFRSASYIHDYYLIYASPALAVFAALTLSKVLPSVQQARFDVRRPSLQPFIRPLIVSVLLVHPIFLYVYLNAMYGGSDQADPITIAAAIRTFAAPDDEILSNLPTVGIAIEFYAERSVEWRVPPEEALTRRSEGESIVYFQCDSQPMLPPDVVSESQQVIPGCWLVRLD